MTKAHPYMANSAEQAKRRMLDAVGASDAEQLFEQIPADHLTSRDFGLPAPLVSEVELNRHMSDLLGRNRTCEDHLNFLGAGVWNHYVPAVCDEIWTRSEFLTSVWGTPSSDLGRNQAWFEFASQLGELLGMEFVGLPVYSWGAAAGHALRMAARIAGRNRVLIPDLWDPRRRSVARTYAGFPELPGHLELVPVATDMASGRLDMEDLERKLDGTVAAVYFENPSYLGVIEDQAAAIAGAARRAGAETVVGVDPVSLGVLAPPADYGADIAIGSTQPLGVRMNGGGGVGGFIATRDEERYARQYPTLQVSITDTIVPGERGFGLALFSQSSYGSREAGKDWTGNSVYLWTIANAVYMSLLGREGFRELGRTILQRSHYAARLLDGLPGVAVRWPSGFFKEFVVGFDECGRTVAEINRALLRRNIFGGKDLSADFPGLGQSALYCVTELHTRADLDRLAAALGEAIG